MKSKMSLKDKMNIAKSKMKEAGSKLKDKT